jgi:ketol-acid reductoisomerase
MKTYYDIDADIKHIKDQKIAIIGYGIQGRAQALNLRDQGCQIVVGNLSDKYLDQAIEDGFEAGTIDFAVKQASVIMVLIPDQAQKQIYNDFIEPHIKSGDTLVFAHGFSIHYKEIVPPKDVNVCLLAPRMPGKPIRDYYLNGGGVPAFVDVYQDGSGNAWDIILALSRGIGATKAGAMHITFKEETEIDLFIEQFLLPIIIRSVRLSFDTLAEHGFTPESTLMELYGSGEIGELLLMSAKMGIYNVWRNNASPTCQYGIFRNSEKVLNTEATKELIGEVLSDIRDGSFLKDLGKEADTGYANLKAYDKANEEALLNKTQNNLKEIIKYRQ